MSVEVERLPSKIVQIDGDQALCEDGSLWVYYLRKWRQVHPAHEPPTHAADLAEALEVLRRLENSFWPMSYDAAVLFQDVRLVLKKHGITET